MTALSININKVAVLRNARGGDRPDVPWAAQVCIDAGADGITVHPRPDCRHITPEDVYALAESLTVEYNLEGNPYAAPNERYPGFMELVRHVRPTQVTLVPDATNQITSDHGWDLDADGGRLGPVIAELKDLGCRVSLFMDPDAALMAAAAGLGADRVELYTEDYARAYGTARQQEVFRRYQGAAEAAIESGLGVNAGHDLNLDNLATFLTIDGILEVSIGHAVISDALEFGLGQAVKRYRDLMPAR